jgi:hypothetical protein
MNRNILQVFIAAILLIGFSQLSTAGSDIDLTGTYSSFKSTASGDIVGEEIRVLQFDYPQGYWIAYQCAEGEPSEPVFIQAKVKGPKVLELTVPEDRLCSGTYTATFTSKMATLKQSLFKTPLRKVTQ